MLPLLQVCGAKKKDDEERWNLDGDMFTYLLEPIVTQKNPD